MIMIIIIIIGTTTTTIIIIIIMMMKPTNGRTPRTENSLSNTRTLHDTRVRTTSGPFYGIEAQGLERLLHTACVDPDQA